MFNVRRKVHSQESKAMVVKLASIILDPCPVETVDAAVKSAAGVRENKFPYSSKVDMCENREKPLKIGFLNHHFVPLLPNLIKHHVSLCLPHKTSHKVSTMNNQYDERKLNVSCITNYD
ncbi:hypothetical protein BpHYR1_053036 [Brachionus plicatilis]|uniref:Uncharacterized protein n=1 Tax=Brachionus plicatilis TaxID=10195 RepID=A0A3M7T0F9_BRAPC|nr:hypothetical protein BpHYR1_053036 [Brachionus plicatilis]